MEKYIKTETIENNLIREYQKYFSPKTWIRLSSWERKEKGEIDFTLVINDDYYHFSYKQTKTLKIEWSEYNISWELTKMLNEALKLFKTSKEIKDLKENILKKQNKEVSSLDEKLNDMFKYKQFEEFKQKIKKDFYSNLPEELETNISLEEKDNHGKTYYWLEYKTSNNNGFEISGQAMLGDGKVWEDIKETTTETINHLYKEFNDKKQKEEQKKYSEKVEKLSSEYNEKIKNIFGDKFDLKLSFVEPKLMRQLSLTISKNGAWVYHDWEILDCEPEDLDKAIEDTAEKLYNEIFDEKSDNYFGQ